MQLAKQRSAATVVGVLAAPSLALLPVTGDAEPAWDMESLTAIVQPLQHSLNGFLPIRPQSLPLPTNDDAVTLRNSGALRRYVLELWARGIAATVQIGGGSDTDAGAIATALTLQEAGVPIHVWTFMPGAYGGAAAFWPEETAWSKDPNGMHWPAFPLATPEPGYDFIKRKLRVLKDNEPSIRSISGLWMDYESHPLFYFDVGAAYAQRTYASQYYSDAHAAGNGILPSRYAPALLTNDTYDSRNPMWRYSYDLRYVLLKRSARQALTDVYGPAPIYGNYGAYYSSTSVGYIDNAGTGPYPPAPPPESGIVAMPAAYANNAYLANDFKWHNPNGHTVTRDTADAVYWHRMLTAVSTSAANNGPLGRSIPFVSFGVADVKDARWFYWAKMTPALYKELLRHLWLRGVSGMYVFNRNPNYQSPADSFNELELARSVLDEMLSFRGFLADGVPMTYAVSSPLFGGGAEWSGLANRRTNATQWLVRTVSRTGSDDLVRAITPRPGLAFTNLPAPRDGATYLLNDDGTRHRVDVRPPSLYLNLEKELQGSLLSPDVPSQSGITSVLNGAYGLYAHEVNRSSLALNEGDSLRVQNANEVFNAAAFTIEAFVNVDSHSPDGASLLSKGHEPAAGRYDWTLRLKNRDQLELQLQLDDGSTYTLRSAPTPGLSTGWHHIAITYETEPSTATAALYIDHAKSASNRLPHPMKQGSNDDLVIGQFERAIAAHVDEVRFTREALDPLQMLVNAPLQ